MASSPSIVMILSDSLTSEIGVWHERTASPLICTVQAPHRLSPQPNLVPVIPRFSRITQSSGVSAWSTSTVRRRPFTEILAMMYSLSMPLRESKP